MAGATIAEQIWQKLQQKMQTNAYNLYLNALQFAATARRKGAYGMACGKF